MQHLPILEVERRAVRAAICPACYQRPPHSEGLAPSVARACEPRCKLFEFLPRLMEIAAALPADVGPGGADWAVREDVCNHRCSRPGASDYCSDRLNETCPLARFAGQAVALLQVLSDVQQHRHVPVRQPA